MNYARIHRDIYDTDGSIAIHFEAKRRGPAIATEPLFEIALVGDVITQIKFTDIHLTKPVFQHRLNVCLASLFFVHDVKVDFFIFFLNKKSLWWLAEAFWKMFYMYLNCL